MLFWDERGNPYAAAFNDHYFCVDHACEEALHVGCDGNDLRDRFAALDPAVPGRYNILETGFGTGLDFCCVRRLWDSIASPSWTLRFVSVELYPLSAADIARALLPFAELDVCRRELVAAYAPVPGGRMDAVFSDGRVELIIVFDDAARALGTLKDMNVLPEGADACLLDGFAPARNPQMWSDEVFAGIAALSRPGTTCSAFTVAGMVRRGLEARGFKVRRVPGHGKKKQILRGVFVK